MCKKEQLRISLSVFGRFHFFDLAVQLQQRNYLYQLITTYPKILTSRWRLQKHRVYSHPLIEVLYRVWLRLPKSRTAGLSSEVWFNDTFDISACRQLQRDADVFVGRFGVSLFTLRHAKSLGIKTVLEKCNSHMAYQTEILHEEYSRWGLRFRATHPRIYERELEEYDVADRIAIPSLFVKRSFLEKGIAEQKLIHIPYGVSLTQFYPVPKEDKIFRVMHCGNITIRKGIPYLLKAFSELNLPNAELWLVGACHPEIKPILSRFRDENIILKGKHPQNQLRWFYSQCSVFCLASIEEGLALVQAQAMACGLPVIHTTNTGGEDIVREGLDGFCLPIRDVEAIKEKILFFYENPDRREEMGRNALEQARRALSWEEHGDRMIAAYRNLLGEAGKAA